MCAGTPLILEGMFELRAFSRSQTVSVAAAAVVAGIFLIAGLWTPVAGVFQAILEFQSAFWHGSESTLHLVLAALGISLIMLGPGAWSFDARLFGRKRIDIT